MSKPATPQGISRLLGAEDFGKSTSSPSRIRGPRNYSPGFVVERGLRDGVVLVSHRTFSTRPYGADLEQIEDMLKRYTEVITARGYRVARNTEVLYGGLIVTAGEDTK
jgi:hypothetical protein